MNITFIANMISLLGAIVMVGIGLIKENKTCLRSAMLTIHFNGYCQLHA